jgi:hypothetical protein
MSGSKHFVNTYRFTWKAFGRKNRAISFMQQWPGRHQGRYWKRQLSKARRRAWKNEILYNHRPRSVDRYERECNWKTW